ncbi:UTP--glucose-1-phosphate uridylyltransferase [Candidatus Saccharibacteria bacterium]|nr:MAG: UTP--glucose-1-phosphate uridylyltransferase [Candidatus Saccharibacteria bacterium]
MANVSKAVITAAGFGTRLLPQVKAMPKEMLPLVDKPIIQYIVEDLVAAGIQDIIIVGSSNKRSIEDHFDLPNEDLLANLRAGGEKKRHYIDQMHTIANLANFIYIRQKGPYGNATPLLSAAHLIGNEPFIYAYADDLYVAQPNAYQQMIDLHEEHGGSIIPCVKISDERDYGRYGIVAGDRVNDTVIRATGIVEKPGVEHAPSNFAAVGGYLFTPDVLDYLERGLHSIPDNDEFWVTNGLVAPMLADGHAFYGCEITNGTRYDTGDKLEYMKTAVEFALRRDDIGPELREHLRSIILNGQDQ